jgi:tetratricopeptide (TPR) repeat protein
MDQLTLQQTFDLALQHHRAGRLQEAEQLYRQIVARQPDHVGAMHCLGVIASQVGRNDIAVDLIGRAIAIDPNSPQAHNDLGSALRGVGKIDEAIAAYRRAIVLSPNVPEAHSNLGVALKDKGQLDEAIAACRQAIALRQNYPGAHNNLGNALKDKGLFDEAIAAYRQAIALRPGYSEAYSNLGNALREQGQLVEAIEAYRQAIAFRPGWAMPRLNLGQFFREQGQFEEARLACQQAAECEPNNAEAHSHLAAALAELHRFDEAAGALDRAAALAPDSASTHEARGLILARSGKGDLAVESFRRALEIAPDSVSGRINLGQALRQIGRFTEAGGCFRQILDRRPGAVQAYVLMASVGAALDAAEIARLSTSVDDPKMPIRDRAALGFVLGKMLDDAGRFDEAFAHYARANSLVLEMRHAAGERYDSEEFARRVNESIAMFTRGFFEGARDWGERSELPVFIVGMPRSGTSLVEQIASSHPEVFGAGELRDIGAIATSKSLAEPDAVKDAARGQLDRLRALGGPALRVIDKMPANVEHLGLIATLFPAARVILCRRDPRDTCLSCFCQHFDAGNLFSFDLAQCGRHHVQTDRLTEHWLKALPLRMLQVRYEDLVADLEGQSRGIISFLGLRWSPACLNFHRTERTVQTASDWQVRQPLYTRSVGRWRNYETHLGPLFETLGLNK